MANLLDRNVTIPIKCPQCNNSFSITTGQVLDEVSISCPECQIKYETKGLKEGLIKTEGELKKFEKNLEGFSK
jgi:hypothetical protein